LKIARCALVAVCGLAQTRMPLVLVIDFGTQDGAGAAMKGGLWPSN
jgi:hypothetical protein